MYKIQKIFILTMMFFIGYLGYAQNDNTELQQIADADQQARNASDIDWKMLNKQDSLRRVRVHELIAQGKVNTAKDYFNAGIVFQHGNDTISSTLAVKNFKMALDLDENLNRWWYAAAVDRDLMRKKKPQIYGTQFIQDATTNGKWKRYSIDTSKITDEERRYYSVETLAEQEEKEHLMNQKTIEAFYAETQSIDQTVTEIKNQHSNGALSAYNTSEEAINNFGYALINKNLYEEALKVLELNTKLYPHAFNTFDSYGEILLKMNRRRASIKAYKKSLLLNPKNDNATEMLKKLTRK